MREFSEMIKSIINAQDLNDEQKIESCWRCGEPIHCQVEFNNRIYRMPIVCECQKIKLKSEEEVRQQNVFLQRMEELRKDGISDPAYWEYTFENDDNHNKSITDVCKKYVENWEEMRDENIGILFYGSVGTGKTFLACAIANALLAKCVPVSVTNFPRILNRLQSFGDERQKIIDKLQRYDLLVVDDLGVERDTSYSVEQIFNVIDTRDRSNKPIIITTNLSIEDLMNPTSLAHARIYDRVLEMCPMRIVMQGESRRRTGATERRNKAKKILGI